MDILIADSATEQNIISALQDCSPDDAVCCQNETTFKKAKLILLKEKLKNVTIQLLDEDGYAIKQVTSKPKSPRTLHEQLNGRQIAVIKALEKVLMHCKKEQIQLVGYSDELVALPARIAVEEIANAGAIDVQCHGVYQGASSISPEADG